MSNILGYHFFSIPVQIQPILMKIYSFYSRSPKRYREIRATASARQETIVSFKRVEGTRWIGHRLRASESFLRNYGSLITHLEDMASQSREGISDVDKATVKGWLKRLKNISFLAFLHFYIDVLGIASALSQVFQRADISVQELKESVTTHLQSLRNLSNNPNTAMMEKLREKLQSGDDDGEGDSFEGVSLSGALEEIEDKLTEERTAITTSMLLAVEKRLDFHEDPVLESFDVFDPSIWPSEKEQLASFGAGQIRHLLDHFKVPLEANGVVVLDALAEWELLKVHITKHYQGVPYKEMWKAIFARKAHLFPNILHLVAIMMVLPVSNAQLERAFSAMGRVVTDWRKSLATETISDLLLITLEGPPLSEFDAAAAVTAWFVDSKGKIRPNKRPSSSTAAETSNTGECSAPPAIEADPSRVEEPDIEEDSIDAEPEIMEIDDSDEDGGSGAESGDDDIDIPDFLEEGDGDEVGEIMEMITEDDTTVTTAVLKLI